MKTRRRSTGPSLATLLKADLTQLAARANRAIQRRVTRLQRQARALRRANLQQRRGLARLERGVARLGEAGRRSSTPPPSGPGVPPAAVRALRARLEMTREQFARYLGVSPGSIFLWESGRARPRATSLARLRKAKGGAPRAAKTGATRRRKRAKRPKASRTRAARGR